MSSPGRADLASSAQVATRLPDFLVIGAFKSGTTSLISYLTQHPQVFMPDIQEPNYFANPRFSLETAGDRRPVEEHANYHRLRTETLGQYQELFRLAPDGTIVGECSPHYLEHSVAPPRIKQLIPGAKLVAILRHPVDRSFSHYVSCVRDGIEGSDFSTAIARQPGDPAYQHYVHLGFYGRQLSEYFRVFGATQIRVLLYEDLRSPEATFTDLFEWLGVDSSYRPDVSEHRNPSGVPANRTVKSLYKARRVLQPKLKPVVPVGLQRYVDRQLSRGLRRPVLSVEQRAALLPRYREDIERLETLIDRDLSNWLSP